MIYTGDGLNVCICANPTQYHHWMAFASYSSLKHFLPDSAVELVVYGSAGLHFSWASMMRLKIHQRKKVGFATEFKQPGLLAIPAECMAVRQWQNDFVNSKDICSCARSESCTPLVDVSNGVGTFVPSEWIDKHACFLSFVNRFRTGNETANEVAVLDEWQKAASLAAYLGLNR